MKNLFERDTLNEVLSRIDSLRPDSPRQWGKMDAAQMMAHCSITMDIASGRLKLPRVWIGRLLAPFVKSLMTNESHSARMAPPGRNSWWPTGGTSHANAISSRQSYECFPRVAKPNAHSIHTHSSEP